MPTTSPVFQAYFVDGGNLHEMDTLVRAAESAGLEAAGLTEAIRTRAYKAAVDEDWMLVAPPGDHRRAHLPVERGAAGRGAALRARWPAFAAAHGSPPADRRLRDRIRNPESSTAPENQLPAGSSVPGPPG
ncbi:MAG: hypothetical protein MZV70_10575 [Desulfobacterales bacterium]|nr:hypothetical protein [Desulfobacterales bacterium]